MNQDENFTARASQKRRAIMDTAWKVFAEQGYERTSVETIVALNGGSKATVYSYFKSKEDLFLQASFAKATELSSAVFEAFPACTGLGHSLLALGKSYLGFYLNSELIEIFRLAAAEGKRRHFGAMLYEKCFKTSWGKVAEYLQQRIEPTRLLPGGGWTAAMHLRGLLDGDTLLQRSWGILDAVPPEKSETIAASAVTAFLRIYAPESLAELEKP